MFIQPPQSPSKSRESCLDLELKPVPLWWFWNGRALRVTEHGEERERDEGVEGEKGARDGRESRRSRLLHLPLGRS